MSLPNNFKERVLEEVKKRGAKVNCEICDKNDWSVVDQAISLVITNLSRGFIVPPPQIPSAGLICNNCGNIRIFSLGVLGLLAENNGEKENE